jgi:hypothetical protein
MHYDTTRIRASERGEAGAVPRAEMSR